MQEEEVAKSEKEGEVAKNEKRVSFHDQRVISYENRLRSFSTPDKLFRLFATLNITMEVSNADNQTCFHSWPYM